ncbi:MAG: hypothetical protein H0V53_12485, partial [Rubrobacter sp.]|nr:hypothetical protein [Rubrobacter sp.]
EMAEEFGDTELRPREYGSLTLKAGRMYHLCRESEIEEPWNIVALAVCSFEQMHTKDGWEFVLSNRVDIENIAWVFENSSSPEEFKERLVELKEQELKHRLGEE